jgi:hypothetical protein
VVKESPKISKRSLMPETLPITDQHLISRIEREQERRGDKRPTQTAVTLLTEYLTLIEHDRRERPETSAEVQTVQG